MGGDDEKGRHGYQRVLIGTNRLKNVFQERTDSLLVVASRRPLGLLTTSDEEGLGDVKSGGGVTSSEDLALSGIS